MRLQLSKSSSSICHLLARLPKVVAIICYLSILSCSLILFHFGSSVPAPRFLGFEAISWTVLDGCQIVASNVGQFPALSRTVTWNVEKSDHAAHCTSDWLTIRGNYLELEYTSKESSRRAESSRIESSAEEVSPMVMIEYINNPTPIVVPLSNSVKGGTWQQIGIALRKNSASTRVRLHIIDKVRGYSWISLRNRANFFYRSHNVATAIFERPVLRALCLVLTAALLALFPLLFRDRLKGLYFIVAVFPIVFLVHFRSSLFFFSDDWLLFQSLRGNGWLVMMQSHSGHFLPISIAAILGQIAIFQDSYAFYLVLSLLLHTVNSQLLFCLLQRVLGERHGARFSARMLSFLYLLSGLHLETLQWAVCQSTLLALAGMLTAMIFTWDYMEQGKRQYLCYGAIAALASPFCFGAGILSVPWTWLLMLFAFRNRHAYPNFQSIDAKVFRRRAVQLFLTLSAALLFAFVSYSLLMLGDSKPFMKQISPRSVFDYNFLGSQYSTLARGLGLFFNRSQLPSGSIAGLSWETTASGCGALLSLALLAHALVMRNRAQRVGLWFVGQLFMVSFYTLVVLGRHRMGHHFGTLQALDLRYCTIGLIGVAVLLAMPLSDAVEFAVHARKQRSIHYHLVVQSTLFFLLTAHIVAQLSFCLHTRSLQTDGALARSYVQQLEDWKQHLEHHAINPENNFHALGTALSGLYPIQYGRGWGEHPPQGISPILPPWETLKLARFK